MKRARVVNVGLLVLLLVVCVSGGLLLRGYQREQAGRELILAVKSNDTKRGLAALHDQADPNVRESDDDPRSLRRYLSALWQQMRGVKPASDSEAGSTALTWAVWQNNTVLVDALLARGATDSDKSVSVGGSEERWALTVPLLFTAVEHNNSSIVRAMVKHGSDVNAVDEDHETALFHVGNVDTTEALIACGANRDARGQNGSTPLMHALTRMSEEILLHNVANYLHGKGKLQETPMEDPQARVALLLIREGANVNCQDDNGDTPLLLAATGNQYLDVDGPWPTVVNALIARGAQIDAQGKDGRTPLMVASSNARPALVRLLLQHGARVNMRTSQGETALSLARHSDVSRNQERSRSEVIRLLQAANATE